MTSAVSLPPRMGSPARSEFYDAVVDEFMQDLSVPLRNDEDVSVNQPFPPARNVDEEVQIKKKRKPIVKLDENRLLSADGIPRLRRIAKTSKLKFKGKGHEFSDISRLLSTYQFWLDDLYPRAKFKDALLMVEKVGHTRRMQVMRRAWIDESKPQGRDPSPERVGDMQGGERSGSSETETAAGTERQQSDARPEDGPDEETPDGDDLDALLAEQHNTTTRPAPLRRTTILDDEDEGPDEDELDALMAEQSDMTPKAIRRKHTKSLQNTDEPDEDELEALMAEQDASHPTPRPKPARRLNPFDEDDDEEPDEDELDALMAEQSQSKPSAATTIHVPTPLTSSQPEIGEDELDALMEEQDLITAAS